METFNSPAPRLRIALVSETFPPEINGVAMTLGRLVDGLLNNCHEVQLIRPRQSPDDGQQVRAGLEEVLVRGVPLPKYGGLKFGLASAATLAARWRTWRPDVVHVATEGPLGWSAVAAARRLGLPLTSSFHTNFDNYAQHYGIGLLKPVVEAYLRNIHNRTQATMVPTRQLMKQLEDKGFAKLSLMSRGVATQLFTPTRRDARLRRAWGLAEDDLAVLYVGRLAREKNIEVLQASFDAIAAIEPRARLIFVGNGPMQEALQKACPQAHFAGQQAGLDLARHYASGDLFLFPSLSETYGNVVPEALASGLAVVAFNQAAASELIRDGVNGRVVTPGDRQAFVDAACALATDRRKLAGLRLPARDSVAHLDWSAVQEQFLRTVREVIKLPGETTPTLDPALVTTKQ